MTPEIIDYRPVYASNILTVQDCIYMHSHLQVNTAVSGDDTAKVLAINPYMSTVLTAVTKGTGF